MNLLILRKAAAAISLAAALTTAGFSQGNKANPHTDLERLIGTWHLTRIDSPTTDGSSHPSLPIGLLIFTADGHQAVQLMYPKEAITLNNKFVHDGYEASFGTFQMNEATHILRYHPIASATRDAFLGADELLRPTFPDDKHLVMRPADFDQHWPVTWEKN